MATKNLSLFDTPLPSAENMRFGIVVSEWNGQVTGALLAGALKTLREAGCPDYNITVKMVPGAFELSLGAQYFAEYTEVDAVIALGCVIRGGTPHFDYVCQAATHGLNQVQISWNMPVAFGVLTCDDEQQALDRSGGQLGNKGDEAAATAIRMARLQQDMETAADGQDRMKVS
ncbi:MAG: 6,7-dimethyl-8-ribityllumazine synthase [Rikenellaceae bacterium]|nr:6,7-dimethyl-8-ribityllumazine synthase [Rikenellaceae bacterium]MCL2692534.1 6,7-dimethyl-8-ribityllumazine synthase [Rikenellaceae bacterium]